MPAAPFVKRKDDPARSHFLRQHRDRRCVDQGLIHQKDSCTLRVFRKRFNPCLYRGTDPLLVVGIEHKRSQRERGGDFLSMMADDNCRARDTGTPNRFEKMFQESPALELQERLWSSSHALGLSCGQYDCSDQSESAYMKV